MPDCRWQDWDKPFPSARGVAFMVNGTLQKSAQGDLQRERQERILIMESVHKYKLTMDVQF